MENRPLISVHVNAQGQVETAWFVPHREALAHLHNAAESVREALVKELVSGAGGLVQPVHGMLTPVK